MPLQAVHFYAEVKPVSKEVVVNSHGSDEDLAALMVCAICKSRKFREAFKMTQALLQEEGINFEKARARKYGHPTE